MNRRNQKATTYFVILSLLVIGIVYAFLQANLQINGIAKIKSNSWDIHFNNVQINENSVSIGTGDSAATIDPENNCKVDFSVTLSTPGDFYEFTVDVVNAGTIDGMIGELNKTLKVNNEVVSEIPSYLNYIVTYDGGDEILPNHLLEAGHTLTYKVRLEFRSDIEELPEAATISTSLEPQYIQADDTAIKKPPNYPCTFDGEMVQGAEYTNGQYTYRYMQEMNYYYDNSILQYVSEWHDITQDGWGVILSDASSTDPVTSRLCTSINNKPIVSMSGMFLNSQTTNIDTSSFDTSNVTNMDNMFRSCASLTTIDLSSFNTINVTNMHEMFAASGLTTLDLSNFNTTNVTNMRAMFAASRLSILDLSNFNTSNVTNMVEMFASSSSLIELNISNFDLSNSTSFVSIANGIFGSTSSLKKINMSNWKLPADMSDSIFRNGGLYSSPIEEINVTGWDLSNTTNASGMFGTTGSNGKGGRGLKRIIGLDTWNTSNITNMYHMFQGLSSMQSLDLSSFNTSNVTNMYEMFFGCSSLIELNISNFDLSKSTSFQSIATSIFSGTTSLKQINMSNWKLPINMSDSIFRNGGTASSPIEEINVTGWDLSNTTNASGMFGTGGSNGTGGTGLKRIIGLDTWNTSNITNMSNMFSGLSLLQSLNLSSFNTSNVIRMDNMFSGCSSLTTLDLSSFNTSNVTNISYMFSECTLLTTGYARNQTEANKFNNSSGKPSGLTFVVKT